MKTIEILDKDMNGYKLEFNDDVSRDQILREVEKALFGLEGWVV
jgi:hypothetical protein